MRWLLYAPTSTTIGFGHLARQRILARAIVQTDQDDEVMLITTAPSKTPPGEATHVEVSGPLTPPTLEATLSGWGRADIVVLDAPDDHLAKLSWFGEYRDEPGRSRDSASLAPGILIAFRSHGMARDEQPLEDVSLTPSMDDPAEFITSSAGRTWRHLTGRDLLVVRPSTFIDHSVRKDSPARVLITMGGADPHRLSELACQACTYLSEKSQVTVIVGDLNPIGERLRERFGGDFEVLTQGECDFDDILKRSSIALVGGGLTRYECIAAQTPFIAVSATAEAARYTRKVVESGFGLHAGSASDVTARDLGLMIDDLLRDAAARSRMRSVASELLDPSNVARLCQRLRSWGDPAIGAEA